MHGGDLGLEFCSNLSVDYLKSSLHFNPFPLISVLVSY